MAKAIGMLEYMNVPTGVRAADTVLKTSQVEMLEAQTVCPGKYIMLFTGEISAVKASLEAGGQYDGLIDSFLLGNPHDSIFSAIYGTAGIQAPRALGVLETYSAASIIVAADEAAKTSQVELIELRIARGMCGKSYMMLTGEVAAVEAAIAKAKKAAAENGMFLDSSVIAHPDSRLWKAIM